MKRDVDVVLVFPKHDFRKKPPATIRDHLGIAYLAAHLRRHNRSVALINADNLGLGAIEVAEVVAQMKPSLLGLSIMQSNYTNAKHIAKETRRSHPGVHIVGGGHHATFAWREILAECGAIDSILPGEAEESIVELAHRLRDCNSFDGMHGIIYRRGNDLVVGPPRAFSSNLDGLPFPVRDQIDVELGDGQVRLITMTTSRGCFGNCTFCDTPSFLRLGTNRRWRGRSAQSIVAEIDLLINRYQPSWINSFIHIVDDDFLACPEARDRALEIARELRASEQKGKFKISARADSVIASHEILPELKVAGFENVFIGMEACDDATLKLYGKQINQEGNLLAVRLLRSLSMLDPTCGFILFQPYATFEQLEENARFLIQAGFVDPLTLLWQLEVHPGTPIERKLKRDGLLESTYSHATPYAYRFVDRRIKLLVGELRQVRKELRKASHMLFHTGRLSQLIYGQGEPYYVQAQAQWENMQRTEKRIGTLTLRFLMEAFHLAKTGWCSETFAVAKASYLKNLFDQVERYQLRFASLMRCCEQEFKGRGRTAPSSVFV